MLDWLPWRRAHRRRLLHTPLPDPCGRDDEIQVTIAGQACILLLGFEIDDPYPTPTPP